MLRILCIDRHKVTVLVPLGPEEGVAEHDIIDIFERGVVDKVAVDKEEDREVDFFVGEDLLFFEAEALYFGKVGCDLVQSLH